MGLFRPYEPGKPADNTETGRAAGTATTPVPTAAAAPDDIPGRPARKSVPTPTRRQAELERRQRLNPVRTKKQARAYDREQQAKGRQKAMAASESRPEMVLMRDWVDSRWNIAEFMLPVMIVVLALSMLGNAWQPLVIGTMVATWVLLAAVLVDLTLMWRGFKRLLSQRLPNSLPKGIMMIAVNRAMMIRRFRNPPARIKRGAAV